MRAIPRFVVFFIWFFEFLILLWCGFQMGEEDENSRQILLEDGSRFDLDHLENDQLLRDLKDWDYPIFDLLDRYNRSILSAVR